MEILGDVIKIKRGENWALDFQVANKKGDPYMIMTKMRNPFLVITVARSLYKQSEDDFRINYWLDLSQMQSESGTGLTPIKKFTGTEALYLGSASTAFDWSQIHTLYPTITADGTTTNDYDVTKFLFYTDDGTGERVYKYPSSYTGTSAQSNVQIIWAEYDFRIVKTFDTSDWVEQNYLLDMKIICGTTIQEHVTSILTNQGISVLPSVWSDAEMRAYIAQIASETERRASLEAYESGAPLYPGYDSETVISNNITVSVGANLQGGNY